MCLNPRPQPHGLSCRENVEKECGEEAGIPPALAARARPVGAVSYLTISASGYKPDVLFCYDLELPHDFVPTPQVGGCASRGLLLPVWLELWAPYLPRTAGHGMVWWQTAATA